MSIQMLEKDDMVGQVVEMMLRHQGYVPPALVVWGTDNVGVEKVGTFPLEHSPTASHSEQLAYIRTRGEEIASWQPYFTQVQTIFHIQKTVFDLSRLGFRSDEEVVMMSMYDIAKDEVSVKVNTILRNPLGEATGMRCVLSDAAEYYGIHTDQTFELMQSFLKSYRQYAPKKRPN